jgi:hypothetical protein
VTVSEGLLADADHFALTFLPQDSSISATSRQPEDLELARNEEPIANKRESLEKTIAKILHRYCNFGWANYYIPGEKFPSLIEELADVASPAGQVGYDELVSFFLRTQRMQSAQERAAKFQEEFVVTRRS